MAGHPFLVESPLQYPIQPLQHSYLKSLTSEVAKPSNPIPIKDLIYVHGEPTVLWEEEEVDNMII